MLAQLRDTGRANRVAARSADAAKTAADAALRQVEIAEKALHVERPWLIVDGAHVTRREPPDVPNAWFLKIKCKNIGRTPAIVDKCTVCFSPMEKLGDVPDYSNGENYGAPNSVSVGGEFDLQEFGPGAGPARVGADGKGHRIIVYGVLTYHALGGADEAHKTGFSMEVSAHIPAITSYPGKAYDYYT